MYLFSAECFFVPTGGVLGVFSNVLLMLIIHNLWCKDVDGITSRYHIWDTPKFDILQEIRGCFEIGYSSPDVVLLSCWIRFLYRLCFFLSGTISILQFYIGLYHGII